MITNFSEATVKVICSHLNCFKKLLIAFSYKVINTVASIFRLISPHPGENKTCKDPTVVHTPLAWTFLINKLVEHDLLQTNYGSWEIYIYMFLHGISTVYNLWTFRLVFLCQRQVYVTLPLPFRNMDNSEPPQLRNTSKYAKHLQWSLFNLNSLKSFWLNNEYWAFPEKKQHKNNLCALETSLNSPNVLSAPISVSGIDRCNCT